MTLVNHCLGPTEIQFIFHSPEILLVGTGKSVNPLPNPLRQYLNKLGIQVDVMDSVEGLFPPRLFLTDSREIAQWNACTTYNLLSEEGRRVAAALLPLQHRPWKTMPSNPP